MYTAEIPKFVFINSQTRTVIEKTVWYVNQKQNEVGRAGAVFINIATSISHIFVN